MTVHPSSIQTLCAEIVEQPMNALSATALRLDPIFVPYRKNVRRAADPWVP